MGFFKKGKIRKFLISILILVLSVVLFSVSCSIAGGSGSESGNGTTTSNVAINGGFKISVNPNGGISSNSINMATIQTTEYTLTSIDITVTNVSSSVVVGTFHWVPANGAATYDVDITDYGQYEIKVVQTGVDVNGNTGTSEDSAVVNIQPSILTIATIIPGGTLTINIGTGSSSSQSSNASSSTSSITVFGPFTENFDAITLGEIPSGWVPSFNTSENCIVGTVNILATQPVSTPNCLKLYDGSITSNAGVGINIFESSYGQVKFDVKLASSTDKSQIGMVLKDSSSNEIINFLLDYYNRISVRNSNGTYNANFANYNKDTWYTCQINWDRITGYYKVLINNVEYGIFPMMNSGEISKIYFFSGSFSDSTYFNSNAYIDNLVYTTDLISINGTQSVAFTENFDTTATGNLPIGFYQSIYDNVKCEVSTSITGHSSPNCLKIYDNSTTYGASFNKDLISEQTYGQLTYYIYIPSTSPWAGFAVNSTAASLFKVFFQSGRYMTITQSDGTLLNIGNYTADAWNKFTIKWDAVNYKYKVLLNDVDYGTYSFLNNSIPNKMNISSTQGLNSGNLNYIDDITFTTNTETIQ